MAGNKPTNETSWQDRVDQPPKPTDMELEHQKLFDDVDRIALHLLKTLSTQESLHGSYIPKLKDLLTIVTAVQISRPSISSSPTEYNPLPDLVMQSEPPIDIAYTMKCYDEEGMLEWITQVPLPVWELILRMRRMQKQADKLPTGISVLSQLEIELNRLEIQIDKSS